MKSLQRSMASQGILNDTQTTLADYLMSIAPVSYTHLDVYKRQSDDSIRLIYDYKNYNFLIEQKGRNPYSLDELSDGYSAIIGIVADRCV